MLARPALRRSRLSLRTIFAAALLACGLAAQPLAAQFTGKLVGRVIDAATGGGLSTAGVQVVGTTGLGASSAVDGKYSISGIPAGTVTIFVRRVGYTPKTVTGIMLDSGKTVTIDVALTVAAQQLSPLVVTASEEKGTVAQALDEQRHSPALVSTTTADQIAKTPDSDAAAAIRRVSGVTQQDSKTEVRGLDSRYTVTSLENSRLPSPEPESKSVPLDLIPSPLLQSLTVAKTFTPDLSGDFSGAAVNISLRSFPAERTFSLSMGSAINAGGLRSDVLHAPSAGNEWIGAGAGSRAVPAAIASAGDLRGVRPGVSTNDLLRTFRNSWSPTTQTAGPNASMSLAAGGEVGVAGLPIGYIASAAYSYAEELHLDEHSVVPRADGAGGADTLNAFSGSTGRASVLWGGLLAANAWVGARTRLSVSNTYTRAADNEAQRLTGFDEQWSTDLTKTRLSYIERSVRSHQLSGEHSAGERHMIDWRASASDVSRVEPDRADIAYWMEDGALRWKGGANDAVRSFSDLHERAYEGAVNYRVLLGNLAQPVTVRGGIAYRTVHRTSDSRSYDILNLSLDGIARELSPEQLFDGSFTMGSAANFLMRASSFGGAYTADDQVAAAYLMGDVPVASRVRVIAGARAENADLSVASVTPQGEEFPSAQRRTDLLPALSVVFTASEAQQVRLSATRTLSRPEYRELSPIAYLDLNGDEVRGNADLRRALIENYDARWEFYPTRGEVVSVGAFAKRFHDPIERIYRSTTGSSTIGFTNADAATNWGIELDAQKGLASLGSFFAPFSASGNLTLIRSRIRISDVVTAATNPERAMVGQAPYVANAGLSYAGLDGGPSATLLYNVVGQRISLAGIGGIPDTYELPRHLVDLSVRIPIRSTVSAKLSAKNLLDATYRERTGTLEHRSYRTGRVFSVSLSWKPE
jgi:outer membrane receptor protein involved in Fe transport